MEPWLLGTLVAVVAAAAALLLVVRKRKSADSEAPADEPAPPPAPPAPPAPKAQQWVRRCGGTPGGPPVTD